MFYNNEIAEVFEEFNTNLDGISDEEADKRLLETGLNVIEAEKKISPLKVIFHQFADPLIYILLVAAVFTAIIRHMQEFVL